MKLSLLCTLVTCGLSLTAAQNDTQCVENPTGEVSLNVTVCGIPGPEGPQGPRGDVGPTGNIGPKGNRGLQGQKGDRGDIGPMGQKGMKGERGTKGQKGARGIQGIPGPVGPPGLVGQRGSRGYPGPEGPIGPTGQAGLPGPRGPQGEPGDTVLNDVELSKVTSTVQQSMTSYMNKSMADVVNDLCLKMQTLNDSIINELNTIKEKLSTFEQTSVKCGKPGNWRRIAHFDTTRGDPCPPELKTFLNPTTSHRACGRTNPTAGCTSVKYSSNGSYNRICGRVRGYQYSHMNAFAEHTKLSQDINGYYVDGISITQGQPRKHLWSYVVGHSELVTSRSSICPCNGNNSRYIPNFVGNHYYCESGFVRRYENRLAWEDPLWDGSGCHIANNDCCNRYGFFYRSVSSSNDDIEVRWCSNLGSTVENSPADQLEIWVM